MILAVRDFAILRSVIDMLVAIYAALALISILDLLVLTALQKPSALTVMVLSLLGMITALLLPRERAVILSSSPKENSMLSADMVIESSEIFIFHRWTKISHKKYNLNPSSRTQELI